MRRRIRRTTTLPDSLREILQVERDEFWSWHWTFRSARLTKPQPLLGDARVTDLAVNVVLPWLWTRAAEGKNEKLQRVIEQRYFAWPPAEDNSVLKLARQRLLGAGRRPRVAERGGATGFDANRRATFANTQMPCARVAGFPELVARPGATASQPATSDRHTLGERIVCKTAVGGSFGTGTPACAAAAA